MKTVDDLAGTIVAERYTIRQLIGQGGIGKVDKVTDGRLERPAALKVLLACNRGLNPSDRAVTFPYSRHPEVESNWQIPFLFRKASALIGPRWSR